MPDYKILEIHLEMLGSVHSTSIYVALRIIAMPILPMGKKMYSKKMTF